VWRVLAYALQRSRGRRRLNVPVVSIRFARLEREGITRSSHRRCGAFEDERRIVAGDEAGRVRTRNAYPVPRVIRLPPFDPVREAGARTDSALSNRRAIAARALRRVRRPSGAWLPATEAAGVHPLAGSGGRQRSGFSPLDPLREARARTDDAFSRRRVHRHFHLGCARAWRRVRR
jgi:hypothetical protein